MKRLKLALMALFALVTLSNANAQDSNNPWAVSVGLNAIDTYSIGGETTEFFDDFLLLLFLIFC